MSTSAILMMIVTIVLVWGGLAAAVISLRNRPTPTVEDTRRDL